MGKIRKRMSFPWTSLPRHGFRTKSNPAAVTGSSVFDRLSLSREATRIARKNTARSPWQTFPDHPDGFCKNPFFREAFGSLK